MDRDRAPVPPSFPCSEPALGASEHETDLDIEQAVDVLVTDLRHGPPHGVHITPAGVLRLIRIETGIYTPCRSAATQEIFMRVKAASERLVEWTKESGPNWRARLRNHVDGNGRWSPSSAHAILSLDERSRLSRHR